MTELKPARAELLALAAAVRDPEWARRLDGALTAAATAGWDWRHAGLEACRLLFGEEDAEPRAIIDATRDPLKRTAPTDPAHVAQALADMRAAVSAVSPKRTAAAAGTSLAQQQVAASREERHAELDGWGS